MKSLNRLAWLFLASAAAGGCASLAGRSTQSESARDSASAIEYMARVTEPLRRSLKQVTTHQQPTRFPDWDWATGIPQGAPRAEQFAAALPQHTVAQCCPDVPQQHVRLASTDSLPPEFAITNVAGREVRNSQDLFLAVERATVADDEIQIDMVPVDGGRTEIATIVDSRTLNNLVQSVALEHPVTRIVEGGNPWLVVRDEGARARFMVRADRLRGLLQISLSLTNCSPRDLLLPVEVQASCNGHPLHCLSASETLALLYDWREEPQLPQIAGDRSSFNRVSNQEDYLIPINYNSLYEQLVDDSREHKITSPEEPALASLPGVSYPGPAILGDARALSGFLLERQALKPGAQSSGWIMFAGSELTRGGVVDVAIDLGTGLRPYRFAIPALERRD